MANPCGALQALTNFELSIIQALNKKFTALQRLAQLLEQLGDLNAFLPPIGQLVPVIDIDASLYLALQVNCPFLNLPPLTDANLSALKAKLNAAYAALAGKLLNHPWVRLNSIQAMLNDFQARLNYPYGDDYLRCLNTICSAIGTAGSLLSGANSVSISSDLKAFAQNFVAGGGQVLSSTMQVKRDQALGVYNGILDLRDGNTLDFQQPGAPPPTPLSVGVAVQPAFTFSAATVGANLPQ